MSLRNGKSTLATMVLSRLLQLHARWDPQTSKNVWLDLH